MRAFSRFGCLVIVGAFSLIAMAAILSARIGTKFQNPGYVWDWSNPNKSEFTLVVFGDSWVDDGVVMQKKGGSFGLGGGSGRYALQGPSWTEVLSQEVGLVGRRLRPNS